MRIAAVLWTCSKLNGCIERIYIQLPSYEVNSHSSNMADLPQCRDFTLMTEVDPTMSDNDIAMEDVLYPMEVDWPSISSGSNLLQDLDTDFDIPPSDEYNASDEALMLETTLLQNIPEDLLPSLLEDLNGADIFNPLPDLGYLEDLEQYWTGENAEDHGTMIPVQQPVLPISLSPVYFTVDLGSEVEIGIEGIENNLPQRDTANATVSCGERSCPSEANCNKELAQSESAEQVSLQKVVEKKITEIERQELIYNHLLKNICRVKLVDLKHTISLNTGTQKETAIHFTSNHGLSEDHITALQCPVMPISISSPIQADEVKCNADLQTTMVETTTDTADNAQYKSAFGNPLSQVECNTNNVEYNVMDMSDSYDTSEKDQSHRIRNVHGRNMISVSIAAEKTHSSFNEKPTNKKQHTRRIKNFRVRLEDIGLWPRECPICNETVPLKYMDLHKSQHEVECHICGKPTLLNEVLSHGISHVVKLQCEVCSYRAFRKSQLWEHMNTHFQVKPIFCMDCGQSFAKQSALRLHFEEEHEQKRYKCQFCKYKTDVLRRIRSHEIRHFNGTCLYCKKKFRNKADFKVHLLRVHYIKSDTMQ